MLPCWKPVRKERFIGRGKGHEVVGRDCTLDCGGVDRYNEECCKLGISMDWRRET